MAAKDPTYSADRGIEAQREAELGPGKGGPTEEEENKPGLTRRPSICH